MPLVYRIEHPDTKLGPYHTLRGFIAEGPHRPGPDGWADSYFPNRYEQVFAFPTFGAAQHWFDDIHEIKRMHDAGMALAIYYVRYHHDWLCLDGLQCSFNPRRAVLAGYLDLLDEWRNLWFDQST